MRIFHSLLYCLFVLSAPWHYNITWYHPHLFSYLLLDSYYQVYMKYFQMLRYLYSYIPHLLSFLHCCNYSCWLLRCCYFLLSADQVYHTYIVHYIRCCSSLLKYFQKCHKYMRNLHRQCFLKSPDLFYHRCMYIFSRFGHSPL